jgi:hypothetical protein
MRRKSRTAIRYSLLIPLTGILLLFPREADAQVLSPQEVMNSPLAIQLMEGQGRDGIPIKCGFPPVAAALAGRRSRLPEIQRARPQLIFPRTYLSPSGFFLLHYTLDGEDSVSGADANTNLIPDYIEIAAAILDSAREGYSDLGWRDPIDDGDGVYDIYFEDLESLLWGPWFGYTEPVAPSSTTAPYTSASFISLENDYPQSVYGHPPLESLRVTAVHEYHHAVQLAYNLPLIESEFLHYIWFAELSATYHEEIFYDGINDYYNYLDSFLEYPHLSLTATGTNHMYGAALWAIYLDEVYGSDSNRMIWTLMSDRALKPLEAHRVYLSYNNTTLLDSYEEMTVWQLHTGDRALEGHYFPEGGNYPSVAFENIDEGKMNVALPALASRYYSDMPSESAGGTALRLHPSSSAEWGAGIAGEYPGGLVSGLVTSALDTSSYSLGTSVELYDWSDYGTVLQWAFTGDNVDTLTGFSVMRDAEIETAASNRLTMHAFEDELLELHQNYPNPFRPLQHDVTYFAFYLGEQASVVLEVLSLNGTQLWSQSFDDQPAGNSFTGDLGVGWDGRDRSGRLVPAGVYLIIARSGETMRARKMSVIR